MTEREHKLAVLGEIARALHAGDVVWAVGGSLLLYCKGKTDTFRDIDIMVWEEHVETVVLLSRPSQEASRNG